MNIIKILKKTVHNFFFQLEFNSYIKKSKDNKFLIEKKEFFFVLDLSSFIPNFDVTKNLIYLAIKSKYKSVHIVIIPELENATNKESRKELMKSNPKMEEYVKAKNKDVMRDIAVHLHSKLSNMSHEDLVNHIKTHVLQSNPTPLQQAGHGHIRHTTYVKKGQNAFHSVDPSTHYEHIFSDPENITIKHSGTSIDFLHNGKKFASHRIKFTSQSDPLSGIKGTGTPAGD